MNGPEHYQEAERLLASSDAATSAERALLVAEAQVHATHELTAALQPPGRAWAEATRRR